MWFRSRRFEEFREEIQSHITLETDRLTREGMNPDDARAAAVRAFGNVLTAQERFYESRRARWLDHIRQDVQYAFRIFRNNPGFTAIAVISLALGIGANSAIFSLMDQIMFRKLPVARPDELVLVKSPGPMPGRSTADDSGGSSWSYPMFRDLREKNEAFVDMLARFKFPVSIGFNGQTERTFGELASGNYFQLLGVRAVIGRVLDPADDITPGAHPVAVLSYGFWTRRFGSDPSVLNRPILLNGHPMTIVGVARPDFFGVQLGFIPDVFVPIAMKAEMTPGWDGLDRHNDYWLNIIARLKPGVTSTQATASLMPLYRSLLAVEAAQLNLGPATLSLGFLQKPIVLEDGSRGRQILRNDAQQPLFVLIATVGVVLLIACTNLANLLLARAVARQREIVVRVAMGASRRRLIRQLVVESTTLTLSAGVAALLVAWLTLGGVLHMIPPDSGTDGLSGSLDHRVLLFNFAVSFLTGLAFGLLPALQSTRPDLNAALKQQAGTISAGSVWLRKTLVIGQVAFTVLTLAAAGLFGRTLLNLRRVDVGMNVDHLIQFDLAPDLIGYTSAQTQMFYRRLHETISNIAGVQSATMAAIPILRDSDSGRNVTIEGYTSPDRNGVQFSENSVGPGFFSTMGVALRLGREFNDADDAPAPKVCIINETAAERYFRGRNPIGYKIAFGAGNRIVPDMQIIGVVKNSKHGTVDEGPRDFIYVPYTQGLRVGPMTFYVRTQAEADMLMPLIRRAVQQADASIPVVRLKTFETQIDESFFLERMLTDFTIAIGAVAMALAALGIYGVMSYVVVRRTREIGIRMALGAHPASVRALVLREIVLIVSVGTIAGLPLAFGFAKAIQSMLHGIAPHDPTVLVGTILGVIILGAVSGYLPARRAMRIDPVVALRYE